MLGGGGIIRLTGLLTRCTLGRTGTDTDERGEGAGRATSFTFPFTSLGWADDSWGFELGFAEPGGGGGGWRRGVAFRLRPAAVVRLFGARGLAVGCEGWGWLVVKDRLVFVSTFSTVLWGGASGAATEAMTGWTGGCVLRSGCEAGSGTGSVDVLLGSGCEAGNCTDSTGGTSWTLEGDTAADDTGAGGGGGARLPLVFRRCFWGRVTRVH